MDWISQGGDVAQVSVGSCVQRRQVWLPSATRAVSLSQQSAPTLLVSYKLCTAPACHCNNNACMHVKNPKNWEHWQNVAAEGAWELKTATNAIHLLIFFFFNFGCTTSINWRKQEEESAYKLHSCRETFRKVDKCCSRSGKNLRLD